MGSESNSSDFHPIDMLLDLLDAPVMSWQRKVIRNVLSADTPNDLFCHQPPSQQMRLGLDYRELMEHWAIEVMTR